MTENENCKHYDWYEYDQNCKPIKFLFSVKFIVTKNIMFTVLGHFRSSYKVIFGHLYLVMLTILIYKNKNLFFDRKKKRKLANILPRLHFYGMIISVKTKPLCTAAIPKIKLCSNSIKMSRPSNSVVNNVCDSVNTGRTFIPQNER